MKANNHKIGESAQKASLLIIVLIMLLSFAALIGSISFNTSPSISPLTDKRPDTNDTLVCSWNSSADTVQQNVTWYKSGVSFLNDTNVNSTSSLGAGNTSRGEVWNCTVTISNGTDTTIQSANVTIKNAQPSTPILYNSSGQDVGNATIVIEDQANNFTLSATDPDGDALSYGYFLSLPTGASFNSATGNLTWTPEQYVNNDTNITFYATDNFDGAPIGITAKKIFFAIQYINDDPTFSPALANQTISEGQVFNYVINATDEESNLPYNFSMNVTPNLSLVIVQLNSTSARIMLESNRTATYSEGGNYSINITVIDNESGSITDSFSLSINQTNVAPVLRLITNKSSSQGQNLTFYIYADDDDVNNTLAFNISTISCTYSIENPWNITTVNSSHNATGLVNISNLTNNHVICRHVRITVIDDNGAEDYQDVFLNISNTNDPPNVVVLSSYFNNTGGDNISSLSSFAESPFIYLVNATDIDNYTYEGEVLTFGDNATFFDINATTGLISFTPAQEDVGNHTINITVADDGGLSGYEIMNLEIINNSAPVLSPIGDLSCAEDLECFATINATDADGDNLTFISNNTAEFNLTNNASQNPLLSAYVNFTPTQDMVGNHSIVVTVTDSRGASDNETFLFTINNTNDAPVLDSFTIPTPIVEGHSVSFYVFADDDDYDLPIGYAVTSYNGTDPDINLTEYLTFNSTNLTGASLFTAGNYFNTSTNKTYGRVVFVPSIGSAGNYSVNFSVTDYAGASTYVVKNFTVNARTDPPNITEIMPYGKTFSDDTVFSFTNTSNYNGSNLTSINFSENRSVVYNISVTDDTTAQNDLSYEWYVNGTLNSTGSYLSINYGFFSAGNYNVTVFVYDDMYENSSWTWNVSVANVNRAPLFLNDLSNLTINSTTVYSDYLKKTSSVHFIDPDDDLNSNNDFDVGEVSSLTYEPTSCSIANISVIDNSSIRVTPSEVSVCYIYFTATDSGGLTEISNTLMINVTGVPNATEEVEVQQPTSGGGGGRSTSVVIPITKKEDKPQALELIVPELVTIYENKTVLIPITLQNTWNSTLKSIQLNASTNASEIKMSFTDDFFPEIPVGGEQHTTLMVTNYRMGENYNIKITANVSEPKTSDSASVMLNAIEQSQTGEQVETKVTFAQDLMNDNPECLELNELLSKAKYELALGNAATASYMVDGVINGCKYLVSISKKSEQKPSNILAKVIQKENSIYFIIFGIMATMLLLGVLFIKHKKSKAIHEKKQAEEKAKQEEGQSKPYWPGMQ